MSVGMSKDRPARKRGSLLMRRAAPAGAPPSGGRRQIEAAGLRSRLREQDLNLGLQLIGGYGCFRQHGRQTHGLQPPGADRLLGLPAAEKEPAATGILPAAHRIRYCSRLRYGQAAATQEICRSGRNAKISSPLALRARSASISAGDRLGPVIMPQR